MGEIGVGKVKLPTVFAEINSLTDGRCAPTLATGLCPWGVIVCWK